MKTNLEIKKQMLTVLERMYNILEDEEKDVAYSYEKVGVDETKQRTHWRTGELIWEDEEQTIPSYEPIYDYVKKEELDESDKAKLTAIEQVRKALDKLV